MQGAIQVLCFTFTLPNVPVSLYAVMRIPSRQKRTWPIGIQVSVCCDLANNATHTRGAPLQLMELAGVRQETSPDKTPGLAMWVTWVMRRDASDVAVGFRMGVTSGHGWLITDSTSDTHVVCLPVDRRGSDRGRLATTLVPPTASFDVIIRPPPSISCWTVRPSLTV